MKRLAITLFAALSASAICHANNCNGLAPVQVSGVVTNFCVSDYGWSNQLFGTLAPSVNLLGDSAQFVSYTPTSGGTVNSWLPLQLSTGTVSSDFNAVQHVQNVSANEATSQITDGTLTITIDTKIVNDMVDQTFAILTTADLSDLKFGQYFLGFPGGASNPNLGTMQYQMVQTIGGPLQPGLSVSTPSGNVLSTCGGPGVGCSDPSLSSGAHGIADPTTLQNDIQTLTFNNATSASMEVAGALMWDVGPVTAGTGPTFTVEIIPESTPEPGTVVLMLLSTAGLCLRPRLRR